jgi:hypothetical protein
MSMVSQMAQYFHDCGCMQHMYGPLAAFLQTSAASVEQSKTVVQHCGAIDTPHTHYTMEI